MLKQVGSCIGCTQLNTMKAIFASNNILPGKIVVLNSLTFLTTVDKFTKFVNKALKMS